MPTAIFNKARISLASATDRPAIYALRHAVYAEELCQHAPSPTAAISDPLDDFNEYIVAHVDGELAGFISITPPGFNKYSVDKYVSRDAFPFTFDDTVYELRILTVAGPYRNSGLAATLMYASFRWAEEHGGNHLIAMGRTEIVGMYLKHGFRPIGHQVTSGAVSFELLETTVKTLRASAERHHRYYEKLSTETDWQLDFPFFKPPCCFHGGAFFDAIGTGFESLERKESIINADVLDAWFPPSPHVLYSLREHLPWLMTTSPPTQCDGLRRAIAQARGVGEENILCGAGSSDLIYLAFRQWLQRSSRVLILDPMYGEYAHILENVIGCQVDRLTLARKHGYVLNLEDLQSHAELGYDMIVLVNPNNPTGRHVPRHDLEHVLAAVPATTRVWVDEAYLEYVGTGQSLENFAYTSENVIVCKSMSKVYSLSGMRAAYLCASMQQLSDLVPLTPPWAVSLPAQLAAVRALQDEPYYLDRYRETHALRAHLVSALRKIGITEIVPGTANFVMFHLSPNHPTASEVLAETTRTGVFFRDTSLMGREVGTRSLRIAVKDRKTIDILLSTLEAVLCPTEVLTAR